MTKTYLMNNLIEKMQSPDQDHRYMGLTDLMSEIKQDPNNFYGDETMEHKVLQRVLKLVEDKISEVKNQAVKCLGVLIKIVRETQMELIIGKLIDFSGSKDEELRDIAGLALKTITAELPQNSNLAPKACANLTPKLLNQIKNPATPPETLIETLSILSILITRFPAQLSSPDLSPQPVPALTPILAHSRPAVRKRAILTLAQFLPAAQQSLFDELIKSTVLPGLRNEASANAALEQQRTTVQLVAAITRHSPGRIAVVLDTIIPGVLKAAACEDDELREYALQALEVFVLRCPGEISPFLGQIVQMGTKLIKHDPNYAGDDEEDEDMADADADEEDEDDDLDYSDDEDTSYKIRRSATKLLGALIETRPEMLTSLYKDVSPVLIQRFGDREGTVRLEVWATYGALLSQTKVYGGIPQHTSSVDSPGVGGKRKRTLSGTDGMDVEVPESPAALLKAQVPSLAKALFSQLRSPKTPPQVLQAGFKLLNQLIDVLPGSLSAHVAPIASTAQAVLAQSPTTSSITLHTSCLAFLSVFFATHSPSTFSNELPELTPSLLKSLNERHPRVVAESFRAFSALLNALRPVHDSDWIERVYDGSVQRLRSADTDAEVRARAETCMGDLWVCATDAVRAKDGREWDAMCRTTGRMDGAVKVVTRVAREVDVGDVWINGSVEWLLGVLRKVGKAGKVDAFTCLDVLLRGYKTGIPEDLVPSVVEQMKPYISTNDISLLSQALLILTLLLQLAPPLAYPAVESEYLKDICIIAHSPLLSGSSLDALLAFFASLVQADTEIATHVIPNLTLPLQHEKKSDASYANVAKCIGVIIRCHQSLAAGTIAEFSKALKNGSKVTSNVVLNLLVLGEIGRVIDFAPQKDLFHSAIELLGSADEEIRSAASFATGNIAIGNLHLFLPAIVKLVQTDKEKRLLALHALKEVASNCPSGQLESVAETIWVPLFQDSANSEEVTRNVAAACLGKLTTTNPSRYLPQLQARIRDENAAARATVIAAIRYTFADSQHSYDELLVALIPDFLSAMVDEDLTVRRLAMSALNTAARNRPHLIRDHLAVLLPNLYKETYVKPELVRTVQMGPWTHKVDDGLEARKTAYETMYTLLDTCLSKLDLHEFLGRVVSGLSDDSDEIKVLAHMMLFRLSGVAPTALAQRLDEITPQLEKTMKGPAVTKDTVKQDLERAAELQRSTLRAVAALHKSTAPGASARFDAFVDDIQRGQWGAEFKELNSGP
ncbi:hypothetical protein M0805_008243 [Coniferiporia weirii]|nr:hypothetical protein M0805_008243 [Coniferiporia weirii]